jgi:hypothetical protein
VRAMGRQECETHQKDAVKRGSAPPQSRRDRAASEGTPSGGDKHLGNDVARDTQITGRDVAVDVAARPNSSSRSRAAGAGGYTASMPNCRMAGADAGEAMYSSRARPNSGRLHPGDTPPENKVMV